MNEERIIVIEDEYPKHLEKQEEYKKENKRLAKDKNEATFQTSETWHDNAAFDQILIDERVLDSKLADFNEFINKIQIISFNVIEKLNPDKVSIWKIVTIDEWDEEKTYKIGGYNTPFDDRVSYNAPKIKALLWKEEWDVIDVVIAWEKRVIEILEIEGIVDRKL